MLCDGAYGTLLAPYAVDGENVDALCRLDPNKVVWAHRAYIEAGATCIQTNSFLAYQLSNSRRRNQYRAALDCAREAQSASNQSITVHATVGPAGSEPRNFYRDIEQLLDDGVAGIRCETVTDVETANAFVQAWKEVAVGVPSMAILTVSVSPSRGVDSWRWIISIPEATNLALGLNCCEGLAGLREPLELLCEREPKPWLLPSAGIPGTSTDRAQHPEHWADEFSRILEGISPAALGGCCGTTPDHIAALSAYIE